MIFPYVIDEAEAFLLGTIAGEAINSNRLDLIQERLRPFVHHFKTYRHVKLSELPVNSEPCENGQYFSDEYGLLTIRDGQIFASVEDNSRQSLVDLIIEYLCDQPEPDISHLLRKIAVDNHCDTRFTEGESFGRYFRLVKSMHAEMENSLWEKDISKRASHGHIQQFKTERSKHMDDLCDLGISKELDSLRLALHSERKSWWQRIALVVEQDPDTYSRRMADGYRPLPGGYWEAEKINGRLLFEDSVDEEGVLFDLNLSIQMYYVCVGMVVVHLKNLHPRRREAPLPRQFLTRSAKSVHYLTTAMDIAQRELHASHPEIPPDEIVRQLVHGVEPLVRSVWPEARDIGDELSKRIRTGNTLETKFASIANTLYRTYRNIAVHEAHLLDRHVRTWTESLYVYASMKMLLELHSELSDAGQAPA